MESNASNEGPRRASLGKEFHKQGATAEKTLCFMPVCKIALTGGTQGRVLQNEKLVVGREAGERREFITGPRLSTVDI